MKLVSKKKFKLRQIAWDVKLLLQDGEMHILEVTQQDIHEELTLSSRRAVQKSCPSWLSFCVKARPIPELPPTIK